MAGTDLVALLKAHKLKATTQRLAVLEALRSAGRPLTAREVRERVHRHHPTVSLDTVYRTLGTLTQVSLVSQINLQNREAARFELQAGQHHHHAVCLRCGTGYCLPPFPERDLAVRPAEDPDFEVIGHALELYGYCSACRGQRQPGGGLQG
ncbi:MAG: transcriptional repressor [Clostridia bacterium]|nr:transcriptional repressor [Clostridia bacterium]